MPVPRAVELPPEEAEILSGIHLRLPERIGYAEAQANGERVCWLMKALLARGAIPQVRLSYFIEAEHNIGMSCSIAEEFERNGTSGDDIYRHPHFPPYLRYFLYGPDLPKTVVAAFSEAVDDCGLVTSGDITKLSKLARQLARDRHDAAEFYKLALELGLGSHARMIRDAVFRLATGHDRATKASKI